MFGKKLPVGIITQRITETELSGKKMSPEQLEDELKTKIFFYEKNFIGDDTKIISRTIDRTEDENSITLTVHYKLEGEIGTEKPLLLKQEQLSYGGQRKSIDKTF